MVSNNNQSTLKPRASLKLYLVTDANMCSAYGLVDTVCRAIEGGVTMVQLRDKSATDAALYHTACQLKEAINGKVPLLLNDRVLIAKKAGLDGAHIGQTDMSVTQARSILGKEAWLGLTINTQEQLIDAQNKFSNDLDYVGLGPVFATQTKLNHEHPLGIDTLQHLIGLSKFATVAIGGIHLSNAKTVYATGCYGIAVVSEICASHDPKQAAHNLLAQTR